MHHPRYTLPHWTRKPLQSLTPKKNQKLNLSTTLPKEKCNKTNNMLTWHINIGAVFTIFAHCHLIDHPNTKYQTITACLPQWLLNQTPPKDSVKVYSFLPTPFAKPMPWAGTGQHTFSWIPMELNTLSHKPDALPPTPPTLQHVLHVSQWWWTTSTTPTADSIERRIILPRTS